MISNHVLKVKFVVGLLLWIRDKVRPRVDWGMKFDSIVGIAEKIQTTSKPGRTHSVPPPRKPNPDKEWSPDKPMQFTKSDWKAPSNIEAAKKKGAPHPGAKNSIHFAQLPNARPDNTNYKQYGTTTDKEMQQLAKEGKCFCCKQSGPLARDCSKKKISSSIMQVSNEPGPKIKSVRVVIEDKKTSSLQLAKPPTDKRMHSIPLSYNIFNAAEIRINGTRANVFIDPCTVVRICSQHNSATCIIYQHRKCQQNLSS